jgi:hypothetical protein
MNDAPRFEIDSLIARYELEPELKDIFVEGDFDREIIELLNKRNKDIVVYTIDSVNVPIDMLIDNELTSGNKQRVIALANRLSELDGNLNYKCLVDKDFDHWLDKIINIKNLSWTEYTSLEMYFYSESFIDDVLVKAAKCKIPNPEAFYNSLTETLRLMYAIKLTSNQMSIKLKWPSCDKHMIAQIDSINFSYETYIRNTLETSGNAKRIKEFMANFELWIGTSCDPKLFIRGHDFISLLQWCVKKYKGIKNFQDDIPISRLFVLLHHHGSQVLNIL